MIPPAITMTLYFIIFGSLIGRRIGEMGGFDYMAYIVRADYDERDHKFLCECLELIFWL